MSTTSLVRSTGLLPFSFDDFFGPLDEWADRNGFNRLFRQNSVPAVNISENKDDFAVTMAAPGLKKSDFKIDVRGNLLVISSEKEQDTEQQEDGYKRREYSYNSFSRSFTLPEQVDKDKIEASYEDGILKLQIPKKEEAKQQNSNKQIAVN
jgi:HSP20 family protein